MTVYHALQCKKGVRVTICHNDMADKWGSICASVLTPSDVAHKPLINYGGRRLVTVATAAELDHPCVQSLEDCNYLVPNQRSVGNERVG